MAESIKEDFYVISKSSNKIYKINRNLKCNCRAGTFNRPCKHVEEVLKELEEGKFVKNTARVRAREQHYQWNRF